jgi:hypothetical protein
MSIPVRLWRILRGRLLQARERGSEGESELARMQARERLEGLQAQAEAMRELAGELAALRDASGHGTTPAAEEATSSRPVAPSARRPVIRATPDPLAEDRRMLRLEPDADLAALEVAYHARVAEAAPERFPEGSPERAAAETRRTALDAAYERLRDALNTTETLP